MVFSLLINALDNSIVISTYLFCFNSKTVLTKIGQVKAKTFYIWLKRHSFCIGKNIISEIKVLQCWQSHKNVKLAKNCALGFLIFLVNKLIQAIIKRNVITTF